MEGSRNRTRNWSVVTLAVASLAAAGCGGGERQDADEKAGTYEVEVVEAAFPERQTLAKQTEFSVHVRNKGSEPVPNIAVTVNGFSTMSEQAGLADPERPVWIVDSPPKGGITAYTNTWALGALKPGEDKTFTWRVTAIRAGAQEVNWSVAAGLDGKAKTSRDLNGSFKVSIAGEPAQAHVDPETGEVVREPAKSTAK